MDNWQAIVATLLFFGVIFLVMTEWIHLTIAAFLGALLLVFFDILTLEEAVGYIGRSYSTLALFFGVMVLVRAFEPTKIFDYLATQIVILARGNGKRLLLGIVAITTPICAVLPNATTVMLLAPLVPTMAQEIGVDFIPLLILMVLVANSAGLLTLVGDPATFIIGDAINLSFMDYLLRLSLGGAVAIGVILVVLPLLFRRTWRKQLDTLTQLPHPQINHPRTLLVGGLIMALVLGLFAVGEMMPVPISPAAAALLGAALALLLAHHSGIDSVTNILLPLFYAMMYGATLGGNGTLVGASANIVAAGIAEQHGKRIAFHTFLRYGFPIMTLQLIVSALYVAIVFLR